MKRKTGLGIALATVALGSLVAIAGVNAIQAQRQNDAGRRAMPSVSADANRYAASELRLNASLAARVEVEGKHFDVYVGQTRSSETNEPDVWSVAIPSKPEPPRPAHPQPARR